MRQLATQRAFFRPDGEFAMDADAENVDFSRLLLLAIERAFSPPIVHRRSTLQPMRVIVVGPNLMSRSNEQDEADFGIPRILPSAVGLSHHAGWQSCCRSVRGEILSDESGGLYEKLGSQIRPIQQLASGPFGELIEMVPGAQANLRLIGPAAQPKIVAAATPNTLSQQGMNVARSESSGKGFVPLQPSTEKTSSAGHRKLFADPGQWRVLLWGEFKEILSGQLAHPERLRDAYRLPCYVQVFETERAITIEALMTTYQSQNEGQTQLYFLTDAIAAKLDLLSVLPPRTPQLRNAQRAANTLMPNERLFRLVVANDPTVDVATAKERLRSTAANTSATSIDSKDKGPEASIPNTALRQAIPSCYLKEWEFKISREEAAYDMNARPTVFSAIRSFVRRLRVVKLRNEFRKWQILLAGKTPDDQLWAVRPPAGMLGHPLVREWAVRTLQIAGYDSAKMISEWDVFWRRKGL